jgi:hypothetical protein
VPEAQVPSPAASSTAVALVPAAVGPRGRTAPCAGREQGPRARPGQMAVFVSRDRDADPAQAAGRDRRFSPVRVYASADEPDWLTPIEYSSGAQQHRSHIAVTGDAHAGQVVIEAAWNDQHRPRQSARAGRLASQISPEISRRAWQAQTRVSLPHLSTAIRCSPSAASRFSPAVAIISPRWWASNLPTIRDQSRQRCARCLGGLTRENGGSGTRTPGL